MLVFALGNENRASRDAFGTHHIDNHHGFSQRQGGDRIRPGQHVRGKLFSLTEGARLDGAGHIGCGYRLGLGALRGKSVKLGKNFCPLIMQL